MAVDDAAARALLREAISSGTHPSLAAISDPTFDWVAINGARVDARLRSAADGSEWHVVLFAGESGALDDAVAFRRPDPVPALDGLLVVVNGPAGAGKSSLLTALAAADPARPWVLFDEPILGAVAQPHLIWPEASPVLHDGFLAGIAAVAGAGNLVATVAAGHPQSRFMAATSAADVRTICIGLHCPLDELVRREQGRDGRWGGLAEQSQGAHAGWTYDLELDSLGSSPDELATQVHALVG